MKKTKISCTLGLMLFCASISAMEGFNNRPPAKRVNIVSCTDSKNKKYTQYNGGSLDCMHVVKDELFVNNERYEVNNYKSFNPGDIVLKNGIQQVIQLIKM